MITVDGLCYTYPGADAQTLHGLSFQVREREIFGFLGPSGSGKSTTQKVLIGLLRGYGGVAQILGREVRDWSADLYEQIGISFEFPNHYQRLTARENLAHFAALYQGDTREPLDVLGMVGLAEDADKPVSAFSKGMKIRLNVARSLLHRPALLFLDEPTSGLDPVSARNMKDMLLQLRSEGTTIFLTTHDMGVADELCDRIAFITAGDLRAIDAPAALRRQHGRRAVRVDTGAGQREFPLDGLGDNADFLDVLRSQRIEAIHSQETTLESVFIAVTGEELRP